MFPIRDTISSNTYPIINNTLIGLSIVLFIVQISQGPAFDRFVITYGLVPARYSIPHIASYFSLGQQLIAPFSFMFLHGGFLHLLGNMWTLYIFGDNVEDRLGHLRYLFFYLLCGWVSGLAHLFFNWHSQVPTVGASGAIAGVMGAYFLLHPRARILTLIPIIIIPYFVEIPAFFFLGIWFVLQFLSAAGSRGQGSGIAWWAHVGGFVAGMMFLWLLVKVFPSDTDHRKRRTTVKKKTPHLQVIRSAGPVDDPNFHGIIELTPLEAVTGTRKLVNIPWGFQRRLYRVTVPAGVRQGTRLRLRGMGKKRSEKDRGDMFLTIVIRSSKIPDTGQDSL